jgi:hypothetical protein
MLRQLESTAVAARTRYDRVQFGSEVPAGQGITENTNTEVRKESHSVVFFTTNNGEAGASSAA